MKQPLIMIGVVLAFCVFLGILETGTKKIDLRNVAMGPHLRGVNTYRRRVHPPLAGATFMGPAQLAHRTLNLTSTVLLA